MNLGGDRRAGWPANPIIWRDGMPLADCPTSWGDWSLIMATAQFASIGVGIKNLLIATDFSHHSDAALDYGLEFAHLYGAHAEIVYVVPTEDFVLAGPEAFARGKRGGTA